MRRSQGAARARAVLSGVLVFAGVGLGIRCLGDDAATSMAATATAQANVRSFRVRITITTETTTRSQTTEFVAPDRIHITSEKEETISVPEGTFTRRQGGPWKASPANISLVLKQIRNPAALERIQKDRSLRYVDAETLDNVPVKVYATSYASADLKSTGTYWIGASDHLLRKMEVDGETKKQVFYGRAIGGKSKTVNVYYDYNTAIIIAAPKK
jgi:hypothetical protein